MTYFPNPLDGMKMSEETPQSIKAQLKSLSTEPLTWRQAALSVGEHLGSVGPKEYYELSPNDWGVWAANVADHLTAQLAEEKRANAKHNDYEVELEAKSSRLESEVKEIKRNESQALAQAAHYKWQVEQLQAQHRAWTELFGTTQLTHASAKMEQLEKEVEQWKRRFDRAEDRNREMRQGLEVIIKRSGSHSECPVEFCVDRFAKDLLDRTGEKK